VQAVIDVRKNSNGDLAKKAEKLGIKIFFNHAVIDTKGRKKINSVIISELDES
jgi:sarcosine oxidase subunit alpha